MTPEERRLAALISLAHAGAQQGVTHTADEEAGDDRR